MKKELKRQIKQDELVTGVGQAWAWFDAHREAVGVTAAAVAVVAALGFGITAFQRHKTQEAQRALADALALYHSPAEGDQAAGAPRQPGQVLPTAKEKFFKAAAAFDGVERGFESQPAALTAAYYAALCRIELGENAEAEKALSALAGRHDEGRLEPALARLALGDLYRRMGQTDKAADAYRQAADDPGLAMPRDHALMSLGSMLEDAGRFADARAAYERIVAEFPGGAYAADARSRVQYLETAGKG
jgi:tetratricopeptide (TPR) repeat protein